MDDPHRSALLTDLYQLTMAYGYWRSQRHEQEAVFTLSFRTSPFQGGYAVACGLAPVMDYLESYRFTSDDVSYLATLTGNDGKPLFDDPFLGYLERLQLDCDVDAVPEGTVVFPHEPLIRVRGPILHGQLLETALLNLVNFETLIATKASRICHAAHGESVLEFGLRRAQGVDGGVSASRAAYVGGCHATSNVLAGKRYGIPVRGTHAHSWVMSFDDELTAFRTYAQAMPNNCVFLVDTYDTLQGVRHAIQVGHELRRDGHEMVGIRLDSGDLAWLSIAARRLLDDAGFPKAVIVASNDLDERTIHSLKDQGATIAVWGVGTRLATGHDQAALGGVYKLSAIKQPHQPWKHCVKLSEQALKTSNPGILQTRRFRVGEEFIGDMIYDEILGLPEVPLMVDPLDMTRRKHFPQDAVSSDLLVPIMRRGRMIYQLPPISERRALATRQLQSFHAGITRFDHPHQYPVGLEAQLHAAKTDIILQARLQAKTPAAGGGAPS
jgi:nicotinate phosphoribosyltransferase